ncbi:opioid growth factor receptor-related protein [Enterovibrio paralichthyis]|uniref:opioid growth factor receptor-related protein n=1 Tax=Enterovibrio paralichthyis TaxID=2853805 RepID=UPI001C48CCD6|nr:hypothetical protein [Enterovibrio paralichthyis]
MSKIASYMNGNEPDVFGRFISEIHNYNHFWLEHDHKFIQVLFPIDYGHKFNKHALLVEQEDIDAFIASDELRNVHLRSLDLMLDYYGLERRGEDIVVRDELTPKSHDWLKPKNHNQLRITRIIRSLLLLGNKAVAQNLQRVFIREAKRIGTVSDDTLVHWENATA